VNAIEAGALPLNTLANAILERNEQRQVVMDNNYERLQGQQRQQQVILK
jgi:TPP-dependent indolepyruvate ferredoxin oxidoreductase alpha subunit